MATALPATRPTYTDDEIHHALVTLALQGNSPKRAAEALKAEADGKPSPHESSLKAWRAAHAERYHDIRENHRATSNTRAAQRAEDIRDQALDAMELAVQKIHQGLVMGSYRDPSQVGSNLAKIAAQAGQSAALARGEPTQISEVRTADEIIRSITAKLPPGSIVDSTAEEVTG